LDNQKKPTTSTTRKISKKKKEVIRIGVSAAVGQTIIISRARVHVKIKWEVKHHHHHHVQSLKSIIRTKIRNAEK
jgi:hypothetical protein